MRVLLAVLLTVTSVTAYDAVLFSNDQKITKDFPSMANLLSTASADTPLVFIVNPDFTLGQFSREASAYSSVKELTGLPAIVKASKYHASRYFAGAVHAPGAVIVTAEDNFVAGAAIYILAGEEWTNMQSLAEAVLGQLGAQYTAVITATEAVFADLARVKRVATSEMENDASPSGAPANAGGADVLMPMNLPPYNRSEYPDVKPHGAGLGSCLLYLEGVNIVVQNSKKAFATIPVRSYTNQTSWSYADGDVQCANGTAGSYKFVIRMKLKTDVIDPSNKVKIASGSQLMFTLLFTGDKGGYWQLSDVVADNVVVEGVSGANFISGKAKAQSKVMSTVTVQNVGIQSVWGYAMACSDSQAAFFKSDQDGVLIGVSLYNTEVQTYGVSPDTKTNQMYFTRQAEDCIGTFSVGSWMAIVSILIMIGGLLFGYLMLNSVQTMDRFDDPKHKQIVINVRE